MPEYLQNQIVQSDILMDQSLSFLFHDLQVQCKPIESR